MDEDEYRDAYREINTRACAFEKALLGRRCGCGLAERFNLADREGVGCRSARGQRRCLALLGRLREKAQFALGLARAGAGLPHGQEIKVQVGGLQGIARALETGPEGPGTADVNRLLDAAAERFGSLEALPFEGIVRCVAQFRARPGRRT